MRFFRTLPRSETLEGLLHRAALVALLTLAPIVTAAFSRLDVPSPTVERSTAVAAEQSGSGPLPGPVANPSPPGSATPPSSSPLIPLGTLAEIYPELRGLAAAPSFTIDMYDLTWAGSVSVTLRCPLARTRTDFDGTCSGRIETRTAQRQYELPVNIPADAVERFLRELTTMPVAEGPYRRPQVGRQIVDVYTNLEFVISSEAGPVRVFSVLTPSIDRPWAVEYGGRQMVVESDAPLQAYQAIRPYLAGLFQLIGNEIRLIVAPVPSLSPRQVPR